MIRRGDVLLRGESLRGVLMRLRHAASLLQVVPVQQLLLTTDRGEEKGLPRKRCAALWKDRRTMFASIFLALHHYPFNIARTCRHKFYTREPCRYGNRLSDTVGEPEFQVESRERFCLRELERIRRHE